MKCNKNKASRRSIIMKHNTHSRQKHSTIHTTSKTGKIRRHSADYSRSIILSFALIVVCCCIFGSSFSSAHESTGKEPLKNKCYKSIQVQAGDSLWSIACDNITEEYDSIDEYMDEIAEINHISTISADSIKEGTYLTVSYYDEI